MNENQRKVLIITAALLIVMLLFPPFERPFIPFSVNMGYSFLLEPPTYDDFQNNLKANVNLRQLGLQFLIVTVAGGLLFLSFKSK
tara:strand:- start:164 stop:418 length:255 start_codon:yes stop_codon:yes gene_type:complete